MATNRNYTFYNQQEGTQIDTGQATAYIHLKFELVEEQMPRSAHVLDGGHEVDSEQDLIGMRTLEQRKRLKDAGFSQLPLSFTIFDGALDVAYRGYCTCLTGGEEAVKPDDGPYGGLQYIHHDIPKEGFLYLFNVIVALEWIPSREYVASLQRAFRRASDYLYDVTESQMAFGQVFFGGPELMDCADVQILASNRFHARSWHNGLHSKDFRPIRLGRGLWHRRHRFSIPWDEPIAFPVIAHEWAHYALGLEDRYVALTNAADGTAGGEPCRALNLPVYTERPGTMGAPEIVSNQVILNRKAPIKERINFHFPKFVFWTPAANRLSLPAGEAALYKEQLGGPEALPLPLPRSHIMKALDDAAGGTVRVQAILLDESDEMLSRPDRWWLYLTRTDSRGASRFVALGTLEIEAQRDGGSNVKHYIATESLTNGDIMAVSDRFRRSGTIQNGTLTWSAPFDLDEEQPIVAVVPREVDEVSIQVSLSGRERPASVWIAQAGRGLKEAHLVPGPDGENLRYAGAVRTPVDGHVLLQNDGKPQFVYDFSEGGPPPHNVPGGAPPAGGAADARALLFFEATEDPEEGSDIRIITTRSFDPQRKGQVNREDIYAFAASKPLLRKEPCSRARIPFNVTLVFYYDRPDDAVGDKPVIYRLDPASPPGERHWQRLVTCCPHDYDLVATPMKDGMLLLADRPVNDREIKCNLFVDAPGPKPEIFQLRWDRPTRQ